MKQEWRSNIGAGADLTELGRHLLAIVGPSGSGKTAMVTALQKSFSCATMIPIHTTRPQRADDIDGHYRYNDEKTFSALQDEFFICRVSPFPSYGWKRSDVTSVVHRNGIAIFPFRHGGASFLLDILPTAMIVFIEPSPDAPSLHSLNRIKPKDEMEVTSVLRENRALHARAVAQGWPTKIVNNHFSGPQELERHAQSIIAWSQERYR